ncbi:MAG TPA: hypothetical protein VFY03_07935 [Woeseiaceae bacterium]|nr:hypothetical protein [Woeseiaceae bacterium]
MIAKGTDNGTIVLDVGKTNAKLSLWDAGGRLIDRRVRANAPQRTDHYRSLDTAGIEAWLFDTLTAFAARGQVRRIVPVGHGAAAALVRGDRLFAAPMDYEEPAAAGDREAYAAGRDPFAATGSPFLPGALNLGLQLHLLEKYHGTLPDDVTIIPWPQYWAWRLCGIAAAEVTSLGCHSDLWLPAGAGFSALAAARGWAERIAPLRRADEVLGTLRPGVVAATGLPRDCEVLCGLHDSNAALLAARGHPEIERHDATVLSTGTWFVAMRLARSAAALDTLRLDEARDCLVNVDVQGRPVPSARFMGGREAELAGGVDAFAPAHGLEPDSLERRLPGLVAEAIAAAPSFVRGVGPYPGAAGHWIVPPGTAIDRRIATSLYLALMADTTLGLVGARERLLVEGRFAEDPLFVRTLASLRPAGQVYVANAHTDVAYGALRLVHPDLPAPAALERVRPLDVDLAGYAADWRRRADAAEAAA